MPSPGGSLRRPRPASPAAGPLTVGSTVALTRLSTLARHNGELATVVEVCGDGKLRVSLAADGQHLKVHGKNCLLRAPSPGRAAAPAPPPAAQQTPPLVFAAELAEFQKQLLESAAASASFPGMDAAREGALGASERVHMQRLTQELADCRRQERELRIELSACKAQLRQADDGRALDLERLRRDLEGALNGRRKDIEDEARRKAEEEVRGECALRLQEERAQLSVAQQREWDRMQNTMQQRLLQLARQCDEAAEVQRQDMLRQLDAARKQDRREVEAEMGRRCDTLRAEFEQRFAAKCAELGQVLERERGQMAMRAERDREDAQTDAALHSHARIEELQESLRRAEEHAALLREQVNKQEEECEARVAEAERRLRQRKELGSALEAARDSRIAQLEQQLAAARAEAAELRVRLSASERALRPSAAAADLAVLDPSSPQAHERRVRDELERRFRDEAHAQMSEVAAAHAAAELAWEGALRARDEEILRLRRRLEDETGQLRRRVAEAHRSLQQRAAADACGADFDEQGLRQERDAAVAALLEQVEASEGKLPRGGRSPQPRRRQGSPPSSPPPSRRRRPAPISTAASTTGDPRAGAQQPSPVAVPSPRAAVTLPASGGAHSPSHLASVSALSDPVGSPRPQPPHGACVETFEGMNFRGQRRELPPGRYDLAALGLIGGKVLSVRVPPGLRLSLFEFPQCRGEVRVYRADCPFLSQFNGPRASAFVDADV
eukprot:TRINITY_DN5720_c0_g1_i2.p1 TRINITY_DN5720_c0_g1~~TRINITY_DN5720_c0_g1_i2.p1  ORF type:complete len:729 (+),score=255.42 TRINITY_DN5720_c0_g1_i2:69-2255(+)